jgi:MFS family permease
LSCAFSASGEQKAGVGGLCSSVVVVSSEAAGGAVVAVAGTVAAALVPWAPLVLAGIAVAGLGTAACAPSLLSLAGRSVPLRSAGAAVGTVTTVGYLGFVVAPAMIGGLARATTLPTALAAVSVPGVVLAVCATRLPATGRVSRPSSRSS